MARQAQKISKRAAHKAAVAARKTQPFVKVRKQRRNPLPFPTDFFSMANEEEREGVLLTRVSRKPPAFRAETTDSKGNPIVVALEKAAPPLRGWTVLLPKGEGFYFATRRKACKFIGELNTEREEFPNVVDGRIVLEPIPDEEEAANE